MYCLVPKSILFCSIYTTSESTIFNSNVTVYDKLVLWYIEVTPDLSLSLFTLYKRPTNNQQIQIKNSVALPTYILHRYSDRKSEVGKYGLVFTVYQ